MARKTTATRPTPARAGESHSRRTQTAPGAATSLGSAHVPTGSEVRLVQSTLLLPARATDAPRVQRSQAPAARGRFTELRALLAEGWEIVQPIFARPLWSVADDSTTAFNFVLRRDIATRLVTVREGRTVERFIRDRSLVVDYRR